LLNRARFRALAFCGFFFPVLGGALFRVKNKTRSDCADLIDGRQKRIFIRFGWFVKP